MTFDPSKFAQFRTGNPLDRAEVLWALLPSQRRFLARQKARDEGIGLTTAEVGILDRSLAFGPDVAT